MHNIIWEARPWIDSPVYVDQLWPWTLSAEPNMTHRAVTLSYMNLYKSLHVADVIYRWHDKFLS